MPPVSKKRQIGANQSTKLQGAAGARTSAVAQPSKKKAGIKIDQQMGAAGIVSALASNDKIQQTLSEGVQDVLKTNSMIANKVERK